MMAPGGVGADDFETTEDTAMTKMTVEFRARVVALIVAAGRGETRETFEATVHELVERLQAGYRGRFAAMVPSTFPLRHGMPEARWQHVVVGQVCGTAEEHGFSPERIEAALLAILGEPTTGAPAAPAPSSAAFRAKRDSFEVKGSALEVATVVGACEVVGATFKVFADDDFLGHATIRVAGVDYAPARRCPEFEAALRAVAGK